ncbi:MAG: hypothetical protein ACKO5E_14595 [bacterium]
MLRSILAVVAGIVAGSMIILLVESIGHSVFPVPRGIQPDMNDRAAMIKFMEAVPLGAKVAVLLAWAMGAFASGMVATAISGRRHSARVAGIIMLVAVLLNLMTIPHPPWMMAIGVLLPVPAALGGAKLLQKLQAVRA